MIYKTINSLAKGIENELNDILKDSVSKPSEEELKRSIDLHVYARQSSGRFRTGSLKNSVFSEVVGDANGDDDLVLQVYNNKSKMTQRYPSVVKSNSQDNRDNIVEWLNDGHGGIWDYEKTNFIESAREQINKNVLRWLLIGLRKKGIGYVTRSFK